MVTHFKDEDEQGTLQFVLIKDAVAEAISKELLPIQNKRKELEQKPDYVNAVIKESAEKARTIAHKTVQEVKEKMGLG